MTRELPRTLKSLLPGMQLDVDKLDYEVIVGDAASETPVEYRHDRVRVMRIDAPASRAKAANVGLGAALGELVGVLIDGASIASPGIVRNAVLAMQLVEAPVI